MNIPYKFTHTKNPKTIWKKMGKCVYTYKEQKKTKSNKMQVSLSDELGNLGNGVVPLECRSFYQNAF